MIRIPDVYALEPGVNLNLVGAIFIRLVAKGVTLGVPPAGSA